MEALTQIEHLVGVPYQYQHGPERTEQPRVLEEGVNCQLLVHLAVRALKGYVLPPTMKSKELLEDQHYFRDVVHPEQYEPVDVFLFGRPQESNLKRLHPAVCVAIEDEPLLLHATVVTHAVSLWSLREFSLHERYQRLFAVKRLKSS
jgi:hypothetical protein